MGDDSREGKEAFPALAQAFETLEAQSVAVDQAKSIGPSADPFRREAPITVHDSLYPNVEAGPPSLSRRPASITTAAAYINS